MREEEEEEEEVKVEMSYRLELSSCPCSFSSPDYLAWSLGVITVNHSMGRNDFPFSKGQRGE